MNQHPAPAVPVSSPPLDDGTAAILAGEASVYTASQWRLMWRKFRKHHLAILGGCLVILLYGVAVFASFLSPNDPFRFDAARTYVPPTPIRFVHPEDGFRLRPFVHGIERAVDPYTFRRTYAEDTSVTYPIRFFVRGYEYRVLGLFTADLHLFGADGGRVYLFGTDKLGRDLFAKVLYGARISMSIGLVGVAISFVLGLLIGGISGYYGGTVDGFIQRIIEILRSFPTIPFWMALTASFPSEWSPVTVYFMITVVLSLLGWTNLARVVRGKFLSLREEDYATAARIAGAGEMYVITRHFIPGFMSHIIASLTLRIPAMIIGETALSFLGIGLRPPIISWGVLLQEAQNINTVVLNPWLLIPGFFVIIAVLAFNFLGDGLRDAADPYGR
jgi:peptide/nickel transport system permease protein